MYRRKNLALALCSFLALGACSMAWATDPSTNTFISEKGGTFIVGKENTVDQEIDGDKKVTVVGIKNNVETGNKNLDGVTIFGEENTLKASTDSSSFGAHNMVLMGNKNTLDLTEAYGNSEIVVIGTGNRVESDGNDHNFDSSVILGMGNVTKGSWSVNIGDRNTVGTRATSIGLLSVAQGGSVAIGVKAQSSQNRDVAGGSTSVGYEVQAAGNNSIALGSFSAASGDTSIVLGNRSTAAKKDSIVLGRSAKSLASSGIALGLFSSVVENANNSTAIGTFAKASSTYSLALGDFTNVSATESVALGYMAGVADPYGVALGSSSKVVAESAPIIGYNFATNSSYGTEATAPSYAKATKGTVSVGAAQYNYYRRITNVAAGRDDVDAVNVGQLKDALANLQGSMASGGLTKEAADKVYALKADLDSTYVKKSDIENLYATKADLSDFESAYAKKADLEGTYAKQVDAESTYAKKSDVETTYAKKTDVDATYAKKTDVDATYVKKTDADVIYARKTELVDTYATKAEVANDYVKKADLGDIGGVKKEEIDALSANQAALGNEVHNLRTETNVGLANVAALSALHMQPMDQGEKLQLMVGAGFHSNKQSVAFGAGYQISPVSTVTMGLAVGADSQFTGNLGFSWKVGKGHGPTAQSSEVATLKQQVKDLADTIKAQAEREKKLEALIAQLMANK